MPDIGQIFPDTDPKWKGASSDQFVRESVKLMKERGYYIGNIDCTIIAQKPKLSPHKEDIRCALPSPAWTSVFLGKRKICLSAWLLIVRVSLLCVMHT